MKYDRKDYVDFLEGERKELEREYVQTVSTSAIALKARGDVFVGRFVKLGSAGIAMFKVRNSDSMPSPRSFWTAVSLAGQMRESRNWEGLSWSELRRKYQLSFSESCCVWVQPKRGDSDFCLIGVSRLTTEYAELLESERPIIAFGPHEPPIQYFINLSDIVKDRGCEATRHVLDFDERPILWRPQGIGSGDDFAAKLTCDFQVPGCVVVQGPPGTGKTSRMVEFAAKLAADGKSVLITALTNHTLMELAKKKGILPLVDDGRVFKTSLTLEEANELPKLQPVKGDACYASPGCLTLSTFYTSSRWARDAKEEPFDFVIMDEASQALLPMIAAAIKLAGRVLLIGDQRQLPPIALTNKDVVRGRQWGAMIRGFETVCRNFPLKAYMLRDTFRLTSRGAECTGVFYGDELRSVAAVQTIPTNCPMLCRQGCPVFLGLELVVGEKTPANAFSLIMDGVRYLMDENPQASVAVLSKFKVTVRGLHKYFAMNWDGEEKAFRNVHIETVDRVQGITVDYCFFLIPNASVRFSLDEALFNVATSRAKYCTAIVADKHLLTNSMSDEVRRFLIKSQEG